MFRLLQFLKIKHSCALCRKPSSTFICGDCSPGLPVINDPCFQCGLPLTKSVTDSNTLRCGQCLKHPPFFDSCISAHHYATPINDFITQLKFHNKLHYANILADLLIHVLNEQPNDLPECIIPVPLHSSRLRQRGFNQALEIARPIAKTFNIKLDPYCCTRVIATTAQMTQDKSARKQNVRNAFKVSHNFRYNHVAIIDDVMTTGHTVNEMSRVLRAAGANRIQIWASARS